MSQNFFVCRPPPLWKRLPHCLLAAFVLRVAAGLAGDWYVRPDEVFQYLEQAHRLVFGYGQVFWEFRFGMRSWLLPAIPALPIFLCKLAGLAHPDFYIPAVKIFNSALSLALPLGMYGFARHAAGERAGRYALLFGCFWHEFVVFASHTFAEQYAAFALFAALALLTPKAGAARLVCAGFLLGAVCAMRFPYAPAVAVLALALLRAYPLRLWLPAAAAAVCALLLWGWLDFATWGRWWHSFRMHLFMSGVIELGRPSGYALIFFDKMATTGWGIHALALLALLCRRPPFAVFALWGVVAAIFLPHMAQTASREYSGVFAALPALFVLAGAGLAECRRRRARLVRLAPPLAAAWALAAGVGVGGGGKLPHLHYERKPPLFDQNGLFSGEWGMRIALHLARVAPQKMRGVLWGAEGTMYRAGGYYYFHHRVPVWHPFALAAHDKVLTGHMRAGKPVSAMVSHIVAPKNFEYEDFARDRVFGEYAVFVAQGDGGANKETFPNFSTSFYPLPWVEFEGRAIQRGVMPPGRRASPLSAARAGRRLVILWRFCPRHRRISRCRNAVP